MKRPELTLFAAFLQEYMWSQRPPLNRATLAQRTGLPKQTVSSWFVNGAIPRPSTVIILSKRLGMSARELLQVAGYDADRYLAETDWLSGEDKSTSDEVFAFIIEEIKSSSNYQPSERAKILHHIEELRRRYEDAETDPKASIAR